MKGVKEVRRHKRGDVEEEVSKKNGRRGEKVKRSRKEESVGKGAST